MKFVRNTTALPPLPNGRLFRLQNRPRRTSCFAGGHDEFHKGSFVRLFVACIPAVDLANTLPYSNICSKG
jgi:hypothetical protein